MTSLVVPKNVSFVGEGVIANCSGLTSIDVENGNSNYNSDNKCNAIIETVKGILIGGCKNTIIPEGTTELDSRAFQGRLGLWEIIIPDRVSKIGYATFDGCTNLSSVKFGRSIAYIGGSAFENCKNLVSVSYFTRFL